MKYTLTPTKLSQRGFELASNTDTEDPNDNLLINAKITDSSDGLTQGRTNSLMNISHRWRGEKCKDKHAKGKRLVTAGDELHVFALWFLRNFSNRVAYIVVKTPELRFRWILYCFERDKMSGFRSR
ncbi:Hypothetical predicted protein [Olea europaea subsp. europaea]|uniref:Uncharacterized protein n=1 Tax=Olea europaea subsp. europaea TaxID=158383 RepID=A0A8S0SNJ9_OLEEU|nr:Hypothetical predicted protein [Olea europaea subsp. europaea]